MSEGPWNRICNTCAEHNTVYSYARSKGNTLGTTDTDEESRVGQEFDVEESASI